MAPLRAVGCEFKFVCVRTHSHLYVCVSLWISEALAWFLFLKTRGSVFTATKLSLCPHLFIVLFCSHSEGKDLYRDEPRENLEAILLLMLVIPLGDGTASVHDSFFLYWFVKPWRQSLGAFHKEASWVVEEGRGWAPLSYLFVCLSLFNLFLNFKLPQILFRNR